MGAHGPPGTIMGATCVLSSGVEVMPCVVGVTRSCRARFSFHCSVCAFSAYRWAAACLLLKRGGAEDEGYQQPQLLSSNRLFCIMMLKFRLPLREQLEL